MLLAAILWIAVVVAFIFMHSVLWSILHTMLVRQPGLPYFNGNVGNRHVPSAQNHSEIHMALTANRSLMACNATETCSDSLRSRTRCVVGGGTVAGLGGALAGC